VKSTPLKKSGTIFSALSTTCNQDKTMTITNK